MRLLILSISIFLSAFGHSHLSAAETSTTFNGEFISVNRGGVSSQKDYYYKALKSTQNENKLWVVEAIHYRSDRNHWLSIYSVDLSKIKNILLDNYDVKTTKQFFDFLENEGSPFVHAASKENSYYDWNAARYEFMALLVSTAKSEGRLIFDDRTVCPNSSRYHRYILGDKYKYTPNHPTYRLEWKDTKHFRPSDCFLAPEALADELRHNR